MNISRSITVACLFILASAPNLAADPLSDSPLSPEALGHAGGLGDCQDHGNGGISCIAMAPVATGIDAFVETIAPPCAATLGALADLPAGYENFVTAAEKQYTLALVRMGMTNCPNSCACAGCIAVTIAGYPVPVCAGCTACCTEIQTASCHCTAPYFWQGVCTCT